MAPRKPAARRQPRRKMGVRKGRKGIKNHLSAKAYKSGTDSINKRFLVEAVAAPTQGVSVANYIYQWFSLLDQNAGLPTLLTNNAEFKLQCAMFDRFRPRGITVQFVPHANTLDQSQNQNDALNFGGDGLLHSIIDRNSVPNSGDMGTFMRYGSHKAVSLLKKHTRSYFVKFPTNVWWPCAAIPQPSYITQYGGYGLTGGIGFYAENLLEDNLELYNEPVGVWKITYHCEFSGKVLPKIVSMRDLSGNEIIGLQTVPTGGEALQNVRVPIRDGTTYTVVYNTGVVDLSGTTVPV